MANTFQHPASELKKRTLLQLKLVKSCVFYGDFKNKTNNKDSKIIIPFPLARTHSKLALEHKAANIDDALVSLTLTLSK